MKTRLSTAAIVLTFLFTPLIPAAASDYSPEDRLLDRVIELQGGGDRVELLDQATEFATLQNITVEQALNAAIEDLTAAHQQGTNLNNRRDRDIGITIQGGSSGPSKEPLINAQQRGDIFHTAARTLFYNHGHTGIYFTTNTVIHAPGDGRSRVERADQVQVETGNTRLMSVRTSQENRDAAADYAVKHLRNRPYNYNFAFNRNDSNALNCSQLVWLAYTEGANIDLDSDGGPGVYPNDILRSEETEVYQSF